jgi:membrane protein YqaA with SNARE-associated domain
MQIDAIESAHVSSRPRLPEWLRRALQGEVVAEAPTRPSVRSLLRPMGMLLAVAVLSVAMVVAPIDYRGMGNYGYIGVFLITLLGTASLVVPVPYLGALYLGATFLDPTLVAIVAGVASALGETTGYFVGATGRAVIPRTRWSPSLERAMSRFGGPIVFMLAAIPNPVFDVAGVVAGAIKLPLWIFMVATLLGKTLRFWVLASVAIPIIARGF